MSSSAAYVLDSFYSFGFLGSSSKLVLMRKQRASSPALVQAEKRCPSMLLHYLAILYLAVPELDDRLTAWIRHATVKSLKCTAA